MNPNNLLDETFLNHLMVSLWSRFIAPHLHHPEDFADVDLYLDDGVFDEHFFFDVFTQGENVWWFS